MDKINNASQNQRLVLEQLTENVDLISNVVQSNSSFAQNSVTTSSELSSQSKRLYELVNQFQLKQEEMQFSDGSEANEMGINKE